MRNAHQKSRPFLCAAAIAIAALGVNSASFAGQPPPLPGGEIKQLISGTKVHLHTPVGSVLPVLYRQNGTLVGQAGTMLGFYLGATRDEGKWWIANSKLCQKWNTWFKGKKNCLDIRRRGADFHWDDGKGESGLATIVSRSKTVVAARTRKKKKHVRIGAPIGLGAPLPKAANVKSRPKKAKVARKRTPNVAAKSKAKIKTTASKTATRKTVVAAYAPVKRSALSPVRSLTAGKPATRKSAAERWADRQALANRQARARPSAVKTKPATRPRAVKTGRQKVSVPQIYRVVGVDELDVLNVRTAGTADAAVVAVIPPGSRNVQVVGSCNGDWCPVNHAGRRGWVNKTFLQRQEPSSRRNSFRVVRVYDGDVLNIRRMPSETAPLTGAIAPDAGNIRVIGQCAGDWCPIVHGQRRGWVNRYYLAPHDRAK